MAIPGFQVLNFILRGIDMCHRCEMVGDWAHYKGWTTLVMSLTLISDSEPLSSTP